MTVLSTLTELAENHITDEDDYAVALVRIRRIDVGGSDGVEAALNLAKQIALTGDAASVYADAIAIEGSEDSPVMALCQLTLIAFSALNIEFISRPEAVAVRDLVSTIADGLYPSIGEASFEAQEYAVTMIGLCVLEISATAASLAPLVGVEVGLSLPSSVLAYSLYGDASRGDELFDRNDTTTPLLMPKNIEALAR